MRIRSFFWFLLAFACMSVLLFAAIYRPHVPAILQVRVGSQHLVAHEIATVELKLTDKQGIPIEDAQVISSAEMTNMLMRAQQTQVQALGHGTYLVQLQLQMAGPWAIHIRAIADGFAPLSHDVQVQVADAFAPLSHNVQAQIEEGSPLFTMPVSHEISLKLS